MSEESSGIIVCKYGGSSSSSSECVRQKKKIMDEDPCRRVMVLSAHGGMPMYLQKDTDLLIKLANVTSMGEASQIISQITGKAGAIYPEDLYRDIKLEISKMSVDLLNRVGQKQSFLDRGLPIEAYEDSVKAFGEEMCARLHAKVYGKPYVFVDPKEIFMFSPDFGNAKILPESGEMINKRMAGAYNTDSGKREIFIVPGFYGYTKEGLIATLSRGASDLTGSYIAAALNAKVYENFTDKDGIYEVNDLSLVPDAKKIPVMTYDEIRSLSPSGFGIFHPEAMHPVGLKMIPVHVRSTANYPTEGTWIVCERLSDPRRPIVGVAYKNGLCAIDIAAFGMHEQNVEKLSWMLGILKEEKLSLELFPVGERDDVSFVLQQRQLKGAPDRIDRLLKKFENVVGTKPEIQYDLATVAVAGKGLKDYVGIASRISGTLSEAGVNIEFMSQGPKQRCIVYGIAEKSGSKALNAIYNEYLRSPEAARG